MSMKLTTLKIRYNRVMEALEKFNGSKQRAAKYLGWDRKTIYNIRKRYEEAFPTDIVEGSVYCPSIDRRIKSNKQHMSTIILGEKAPEKPKKVITKILSTGEGALFADHLFVYELTYSDGFKADMVTDRETMELIGELVGVKVENTIDTKD